MKSSMKAKLKKARKRLEAMRKRYSKTRSAPTNKEVADVIGVSKSTVDVSLHKLRNRWNDNPILN